MPSSLEMKESYLNNQNDANKEVEGPKIDNAKNILKELGDSLNAVGKGVIRIPLAKYNALDKNNQSENQKKA